MSEPPRTTVDLPPGAHVGPAHVPGAEVHVEVVSGLLHVELDWVPQEPATPGSMLVVPRKSTWLLVAGADGASLRVWAVPPGPERYVRAAATRPTLPPAVLVALATDNGVELRARAGGCGGGDAPSAR